MSDLSFGSKRFQQSLNSHKAVLDKFYLGFNEVKELKGNAPIFLDANVLLRIYSTSFKAREKLLKFFNQYKSRIVLPAQVQREYIKNRENVITKFSKDVTQTIPENFRNTIIDAISKFSNDNKTILTDYEIIQINLDKFQKQAEKLLETINNEVQNDKVSSDTILYKDEFISLFQELTLLNPLENDHLTKIKNEFDNFLKDIDKSDTDKETFKAFPGCYEKKEKSDDPYGDYIIYHEMMEYARKNKTDVIFLTYDTTKGDWMQKNKSPHLHYVGSFFQNTGQIIYILDGQRTFDELLDINFKSLIKQKGTETNITIETLGEFLDNFSPFNVTFSRKIEQFFVDELLYNNIKTIESLKNHLLINSSLASEIKRVKTQYSKIGVMRACLAISNPNYMCFSASGDKNLFMDSALEDIRKDWLKQ